MKKWQQYLIKTSLIVLLVMTPFNTQNIYGATANSIRLALDGKDIGEGYISKRSDTMIPLRVLSENLKYQVSWDAKEQKAIIQKGETTIEVMVGYHLVKVNDRYIQLSSVPEAKNGTTYIPLRVVGEALGLQVGYANKIAHVSTKGTPVVAPTNGKALRFEEMPSLLLGNGYEKDGYDGVSYRKISLDEEGMPYYASFGQISPDLKLMTIYFQDDSEEGLATIKTILQSFVPSVADKIYQIISTQEVIPLTIMKADGKQVAFQAKPNHSALEFTFDGTVDGAYIKNIIEHEK